METNQLLAELVHKMQTGEITRDIILRELDATVTTTVSVPEVMTSRFTITKMLYAVGGVIALTGIVIFIAQIWADIGSFGRILVTLGLGLLVTALGSMLYKTRPGDIIGTVFHIIGGLLIPGGALVTLFELELLDLFTMWPQAITFGLLLVFYLVLNSIHKSPALTFFSILHGTICVYLVVTAILGDSSYLYEDIYAYLTMMFGIIHLLLGRAFLDTWNDRLVEPVYLFGSAGLFGAAFSQVIGYGVWEILYFFLVFGGLGLSIYFKNRVILVMSTFFLLIHVSYITGEYFADSLGWPISLVLLGFVFMGLGYTSISINRKYISNRI
jgi:hypothetical protein